MRAGWCQFSVLLERELFCPGTRGGVSALTSLQDRRGLVLAGTAGRAWDATRGRRLEGVLHLSCCARSLLVTDLQLQTTLARWNSLVTKVVLLVSVDHEHAPCNKFGCAGIAAPDFQGLYPPNTSARSCAKALMPAGGGTHFYWFSVTFFWFFSVSIRHFSVSVRLSEAP